MKHQAFRPAALMLSFLLVAAVPAKAGTVHFTDAVHIQPGGRVGTAVDVRLRVAPQSGSTAAQQSGQKGSGPSSSQQVGSNTSDAQPGSGAGTATNTTDPTLSQSGGQVETVDLGDVTGTVCDCGEIPGEVIPGGGFPLWPLFGAIPLVCVTGICSGDEEENPPPPGCVGDCNPPNTPVPEPATLLLFGSGLLALGAGARRRLSRRREGDDEVAVVAEEVI